MVSQVKPYPLVLGTAQFGSSYGIANKIGRLSQAAVTDIVREAREQGIDQFDTAQGYGDSEIFLGKALSELGLHTKVKVISKIGPSLNHSNARSIINSVETSLRNLGISRLYALLIHNEELLGLWDKGLREILVGLIRSGKVERIGVSVYSPEKALESLNISEIDILQVPTNILDRRFEESNIFQIAQDKKKEVYIRSVFLQGLLLMDVKEIPEKMRFAQVIVQELEQFCQEHRISRHQLAIGYLRVRFQEAHLLFGAEKIEQVQHNCRALEVSVPEALCQEVERVFDHIDEQILNPSLWPRE